MFPNEFVLKKKVEKHSCRSLSVVKIGRRFWSFVLSFSMECGAENLSQRELDSVLCKECTFQSTQFPRAPARISFGGWVFLNGGTVSLVAQLALACRRDFESSSAKSFCFLMAKANFYPGFPAVFRFTKISNCPITLTRTTWQRVTGCGMWIRLTLRSNGIWSPVRSSRTSTSTQCGPFPPTQNSSFGTARNSPREWTSLPHCRSKKRQAVSSIARCVTTFCVAFPSKTRMNDVQVWLKEMRICATLRHKLQSWKYLRWS